MNTNSESCWKEMNICKVLCNVLRATTQTSLHSIPIQQINGDKIYGKPLLILVNPNTPESWGKNGFSSLLWRAVKHSYRWIMNSDSEQLWDSWWGSKPSNIHGEYLHKIHSDITAAPQVTSQLANLPLTCRRAFNKYPETNFLLLHYSSKSFQSSLMNFMSILITIACVCANNICISHRGFYTLQTGKAINF